MGSKLTESERLIESVQALGLPSAGVSTLGRPIPSVGFGAAGPCVLVVGGIHGNEPSSVAAAIELMACLGTCAPTHSRVHVVPVLNPDGTAANTKDSARGVDLNRNFPARNFSSDHAPGYFPGSHPLCEPESRILADLVDTLSPVGVVALHAPFACINFDGPAEAWARAVAAACAWPVQADIGYPTPGSLGSWLGIDRGLPILTIEFPPGPYEKFCVAAQSALQTAINPERIR